MMEMFEAKARARGTEEEYVAVTMYGQRFFSTYGQLSAYVQAMSERHPKLEYIIEKASHDQPG